jgi:hypothetical protein
MMMIERNIVKTENVMIFIFFLNFILGRGRGMHMTGLKSENRAGTSQTFWLLAVMNGFFIDDFE